METTVYFLIRARVTFFRGILLWICVCVFVNLYHSKENSLQKKLLQDKTNVAELC